MEFRKLHNTRDLGGMRTADGRVIRQGILFRSGHLSDMDLSDVDLLQSYVGTVVDFRTEKELEEQPDTDIPGAAHIHIPIVDNLTPGISREKDAEKELYQSLLLKPREAKSYMCGLYRAFVSDYAISQFAKFVKILEDSERGVLWHCTAGKDRAGIASAIVEEILGVGRDAVIADYMATGEYLSEDVLSLTEFVKKEAGVVSELADESLRYLFDVRQEYIDSFYEAVFEKFGSFETFLKDGLNVSDAMRKGLRERYLM